MQLITSHDKKDCDDKTNASSYKIDYVIVIKYFLNPEGNQNPISGSKVMAILLRIIEY